MKFNPKNNIGNISISVMQNPTRTTNYEGGEAFTMTPKLEFYSRVCTCLMEPKFYDKGGSDTKLALDNLVAKLAKLDPEFVLKMALYARDVMNLRSVTTYLLVQACKYPETRAFVRKYTPKVIQRADELTEVLALYMAQNPEKPIAASLKKGVAEAFKKFNEYQFGKYNSDRAVKLRDGLRITHPVPDTPEQAALFGKIINDTLATPETWETYISAHGSTKESWTHIEPKLPIMARIRNLRNMLQKDVNMTNSIAQLTNPEVIKNSRQFPYRFYSAYRELKDESGLQTQKVMDALQDAIGLSVQNLPHFDGTTAIVCDNSGSMGSSPSAKSKISMQEIGNLLGAIAQKFCDTSVVYGFGDRVTRINMSTRDSIFTNMEKIHNADTGGSTNGYLVPQKLMDEKIKADRVIIFTDNQLWDSYSWNNTGSLATNWRKYKATFAPKAKLYIIDLSGYGTMSVPETDATLISGWSERVIDYIKVKETDGITAVRDIENYSL